MTNLNDANFNKALKIGRPPNIQKLFPNSKALLVSGKFIDLAMLARGKSICMAANGRNGFVIRGALRAAQRANSALIIEIAKSEGGSSAYCDTSFWNMARKVDAFCNEIREFFLNPEYNFTLHHFFFNGYKSDVIILLCTAGKIL